jgi:serine/threonine protein kinase
MKALEGSTLGRYELKRRIARGGMSEVYLGYDRRVRRYVAIKVLYGSDEPFIRRFEREALAVGTLSHNHILPLYDFGEQQPWYYLVMPFIEGGTLRDYLLESECLTLDEAGSFLEQIASALQHAHDNGVIHRDVKPSNILLRSDGYAYLVDFGLAKAKLETESLTHAGAMIGTPEYMAPEQSNGINDYRSDIYSLGIILYQMLTGRVPFVAESPVAISLKHIQIKPTPPSQLNSAIPQGVERVILKALAKDPALRYQHATEFATAYIAAVQDERIHIAQQTTAQIKLESVQHIENMSAHSATTLTTMPAPEHNFLLQPTQPTQPIQPTNLISPINPLHFPLVKPLQQTTATLIAMAAPKKRKVHPVLFGIVCLLIFASFVPLIVNWEVNQASHASSIKHIQTLAIQQWATATVDTQANAQATLAAQARAQATAGISTSVGAGNVLYSSTMLSNDGNWINDGSQCFFSQGYHVYTSRVHSAAWCYAAQHPYSDVIISAQARLLRGDSYGILFRLNPRSRSFYVLQINAKGEYRFVRAQGNNPLTWLILIDWTHSDAIVNGYNHTNAFLILATGSQFRFYMNKKLMLTTYTDATTDAAYSSGFLGFFVGGDRKGGTEAVFSQVWIFQK